MTETITTNQVKKTTDYGQFIYLAGNRTVAKSHVQDLIKSFEKSPELAGLRPMLVNEKMEIIDGQHNLQACEALELPVHYVVVPGLTLETAQLLNAYQRPWKFMDYAHSYAMGGNQNYATLIKFTHEYSVPAAVLAVYLAGGRNKGASKRFKSGDFVIGDAKVAETKLDMLSDFEFVSDFWNSGPFAMAFWNVLKFDGYDHKRMITGAKGAGVRRQGTRVDYLRELEKAYNFGKPSSNIRFF